LEEGERACWRRSGPAMETTEPKAREGGEEVIF